jgi:uncharacterized protein (TIGR00730 family)
MNVCVFCGSSKGTNPLYAQSAQELGSLLPKYNMNLVYGGGNIGLMGIVADAAMQAGGKVVGVIPDFLLKREVGHRGISELIVVESMHERKKKMADLADAFIALPGGWGTLEELSEILTWRQLGLIPSSIAVLNINNFFGALLSQLDLMIAEGFVKPEYRSYLRIETSPEKLLQSISRL